MSKEDYQVNGVNVSTLAKQAKQSYGVFNLDKAKQLLDVNGKIEYKVITQGLKFNIDGDSYTYWSKKNRVYKGIKDTGLTMSKFLKENKDIIDEGNNKCHFVSCKYKMKFGKYKGLTISDILKEENGLQYFKWLLLNNVLYEKDKKEIVDILEYKGYVIQDWMIEL